MRKIIGCWFIFFSLASVAQEYRVSAIPPELLKNAHAVLRKDDNHFELDGRSTATKKMKYAVTVLNENGEDYAGFYEVYDEFHSIENIEGALFDANGKELKKVKNKDIQDVSGGDGSNLIDNHRIKKHNFYYKVFPYTVEYEVTIRQKNTFFFPSWVPQGGEHLSVQHSTMTYVIPDDYQLRYRAFNYQGEPVVTTEKNKKIMRWEVKDVPAIELEYASPEWNRIATLIYFAPSEFEIANYRGNMSNWQEFGKFVHTLRAGRDELPETVKQKVNQIAGSVQDEKQKIAKLYEFLQNNTRYISIQLGIGGWQPFDAKYVAGKGYGDCKALTNYMYSILKEVGIPSYYALIKAGNSTSPIIHDFPAQQFNHVILCVPVKNDTMWLECTSQSLPAGYLSGFTDDRYALLVEETNSRLVRTPKYDKSKNLQIRKIHAQLDEEGAMKLDVNTSYTGLQQDNLDQYLDAYTKDKMKEFLDDRFSLPTYEVQKFTYEQRKSENPVIEEKLDIIVSNYANVTGKRIFITPNILTRSGIKLNTSEPRKYPVKLTHDYIDRDSVEIALPGNFEIETMPEAVNIKSKFGNYTSSVMLKENKLFYYRMMEEIAGEHPASDFTALAEFYSKVQKADRMQVVLVKKAE